ncbi:stress response translation initiation inhibitor YciH [Candidatus Woesearchaeota archaeon]|nr:stress response translation initiation inhibitor YciH [Candidatus Woesearchaeota archaeon]
MSEICSKCGLPQELCVCESIAKEEQKIEIKLVKRRFGKLITVISGIDDKTINIKELSKKLKSKLACGGTSKDKVIELQGDHLEKAKKYIIEEGFSSSSITLVNETR